MLDILIVAAGCHIMACLCKLALCFQKINQSITALIAYRKCLKCQTFMFYNNVNQAKRNLVYYFRFNGDDNWSHRVFS